VSKSSLTRRQKQILALILAGKVNKEIAAELRIGYQAVRNQRAAAFKVLGISNSHHLFPIIEQVRAQISE
jgi:DNA-binding CsgD family transcriptional regulator